MVRHVLSGYRHALYRVLKDLQHHATGSIHNDCREPAACKSVAFINMSGNRPGDGVSLVLPGIFLGIAMVMIAGKMKPNEWLQEERIR